MPIDYSKIFTPEQQEQIGRVAFAPATPELAVPVIEDVEPITLPTPEEDVAAGVTPGVQTVAVPKVSALNAREVQANARERIAKKEADARMAENIGLFQKMLDAKKASLEAQRTDNVRLARFNALGNALRTMVQPLGWAAGGGRGVTAGVQPYDNRQYIDAFNRAVKAGQDIRNLGGAMEEYQLKMGEHALNRAEGEYDFRRRQNETEEAFYRRLDAQAQIKSAETAEANMNKRWDMIIRAWMQENNSNVRGKRNTLTLSEYINRMDDPNFRTKYLGGESLSDVQIDEIGERAVAEQTKAAGTEAGGKGTVTPPPATAGLTPEQQAIINKWSPADYNKDGTISKDERDAYNARAKADGKPKMTRQDRNSYNYANKGKKAAAADKPAKKSLRDVATR